jgi:hypothetical protein
VAAAAAKTTAPSAKRSRGAPGVPAAARDDDQRELQLCVKPGHVGIRRGREDDSQQASAEAHEERGDSEAKVHLPPETCDPRRILGLARAPDDQGDRQQRANPDDIGKHMHRDEQSREGGIAHGEGA